MIFDQLYSPSGRQIQRNEYLSVPILYTVSTTSQNRNLLLLAMVYRILESVCQINEINKYKAAIRQRVFQYYLTLVDLFCARQSYIE